MKVFLAILFNCFNDGPYFYFTFFSLRLNYLHSSFDSLHVYLALRHILSTKIPFRHTQVCTTTINWNVSPSFEH